MIDNKAKRMSIANILNKVLKDGYTPTGDEMQLIGEIKDEIKDFVDHWDETHNKPSPFLYINMLNKMASLNFVYEGVDLARLSSLLKNIQGERYGFTASILDKDSNGHFTTRVNTLEGLKLQPIDMSLSGYLDAFVNKIFEYHKALESLTDGE